jgi:NitT/TauT family transport system permease protein
VITNYPAAERDQAAAQTKMPKRRALRPSVFWTVRDEIPRNLAVALPIAMAAVLLIAWTALTSWGHIPSIFLPAPASVWNAFIALMTDGYASDVWASFSRVMIGFLVALVFSLPVGLLTGAFCSMEALLTPLVGTLRYVPITALVPLLILWLGIDEPPKIAIIGLAVFFFNVIMIADAVRNVPRDFINVSYTLGANRFDVLMRVILPAAMPQIIDALRVNVASAWNFLFVAELVAADSGMGYRMQQAQRTAASDQMFVGLILVAIIGFALDRVFRITKRVALPWAS